MKYFIERLHCTTLNLNSIIELCLMILFYCIGGEFMDWIFWAVGVLVALVIAVIGFFLKTTIYKNNETAEKVNDLKQNSATRDEIKELSDKFSELNDKYATKEEVREIKNKMEAIQDDIKKIIQTTVTSSDFVRIMTRIEDKIDKLKG